MNKEGERKRWESADDEDPVATFVHEPQDWENEGQENEKSGAIAPFCAFFFSTMSSEEVARTRR